MSTNGNGKTWQQWMLNAIFTVAVAVGGWIYSATEARHEQDKQNNLQRWSTQQVEDSRRNERIAVLENENRHLREILIDISAKLDRLIAKQSR